MSSPTKANPRGMWEGINLVLYADGEWLGVRSGSRRRSGEAALQKGHQAGVPVSDHEKHQERHSDVVLVHDGVIDGGGEIAADKKFNPGHPSQALAILG